MAFKGAGITVEFKGTAENETAVDMSTGKVVMRVNPKFYRPAEVELLIGNPAKAKAKLGWEPKTTLEQLCQMMVEADIATQPARHLVLICAFWLPGWMDLPAVMYKESWKKNGHEVVGLKADLTDQEAVKQDVLSLRPEAVIHLAAISFVGHGDANAIYQINLIGTRNLLVALATTWRTIFNACCWRVAPMSMAIASRV